jgi:hypothetical protein
MSAPPNSKLVQHEYRDRQIRLPGTTVVGEKCSRLVERRRGDLGRVRQAEPCLVADASGPIAHVGIKRPDAQTR